MDARMLVLEQRFATFILLRIREKPGISKKDAVEEEAGSISAKYDTLKLLIEKGLVCEANGTYKHNVKPLYLTELGAEVADKLYEIRKIMPKAECECKDYR